MVVLVILCSFIGATEVVAHQLNLAARQHVRWEHLPRVSERVSERVCESV